MTEVTNGAPAASLDGATIEVVHSYLLAAADEMRTTLIRTAFNPVIYEVLDFGISMYDANADLIAEAPGLTFFLGANDFSLRKGIEYVGAENMHRGDVLMLNYPYWNAAHASDATLFAPVFLPPADGSDADGDLIGYVCVRAHWMDLGAKDAGYVLDSTNVHQEGLLFPGTKVFSRGEPVHDMWLRITVDRELRIVDAQASTDAMPYQDECDRIAPDYARLVGLSIGPGYLRHLKERLGGVLKHYSYRAA